MEERLTFSISQSTVSRGCSREPTENQNNNNQASQANLTNDVNSEDRLLGKSRELILGMRGEIIGYRGEIDKMKSRCAELEESLRLANQSRHLESTLKKEDIGILSRQNKQYKEENEKLKEEVRSLHSQLSDLSTILSTKDTIISGLVNKVSSLGVEISNLLNINREINACLKEKEKEIGEGRVERQALESKLSLLTTELTTLKSTNPSTSTLAQHIHSLKSIIYNKDIEISTLRKDNEGLLQRIINDIHGMGKENAKGVVDKQGAVKQLVVRTTPDGTPRPRRNLSSSFIGKRTTPSATLLKPTAKPKLPTRPTPNPGHSVHSLHALSGRIEGLQKELREEKSVNERIRERILGMVRGGWDQAREGPGEVEGPRDTMESMNNHRNDVIKAFGRLSSKLGNLAGALRD